MHLNHPETIAAPLPPLCMEKLSSRKLVPGAKRLGTPVQSMNRREAMVLPPESTCSPKEMDCWKYVHVIKQAD